MNPRIELLPQKKLVGRQLKMSLANDKTFMLWNNFMPRRKEIKNKLSNYFFSIQVYDRTLDFSKFNPKTEFVKWAAVEVKNFDEIPGDMEQYLLDGGLYAVFIHKGPASEFYKTWQHIFGRWLPKSTYALDQRAHFELLTENYSPNDPEAQEEVWIPIKPK